VYTVISPYTFNAKKNLLIVYIHIYTCIIFFSINLFVCVNSTTSVMRNASSFSVQHSYIYQLTMCHLFLKNSRKIHFAVALWSL
jgi:hypothetical protein